MLNNILRIINFCNNYIKAVNSFGLFQSFKYFFISPKKINFLKHKKIKHKIFYRNFGDKGAISHLYIKNYKINDSQAELKIKNIIDGGSNIGIETIRFANYFPNAKIISIEANKSNFDILKKNTENYSNITCVHAALFNEEKKLYLNNNNNNKSDNFNECFFLENKKLHTSEVVQGIPLSKILLENKFENIDILKLDIEGAERYVFDESSIDWIDKVKVIIFECPDNEEGASGTTQQIYSSFNLNNILFKTHICGENLVLIRKDSNYFLEKTMTL